MNKEFQGINLDINVPLASVAVLSSLSLRIQKYNAFIKHVFLLIHPDVEEYRLGANVNCSVCVYECFG